MANEVKYCFVSGRNLTAYCYYDADGTITLRSSATMTEQPEGSGLYKASPAGIATGDVVKITDSLLGLIAQGIYDVLGQAAAAAAIEAAELATADQISGIDKTGYKLAADGLDSVTKFGQLWRRFFGKIGKTPAQLKHYNSSGELIMTQAITQNGNEKIVGEAANV